MKQLSILHSFIIALLLCITLPVYAVQPSLESQADAADDRAREARMSETKEDRAKRYAEEVAKEREEAKARLKRKAARMDKIKNL